VDGRPGVFVPLAACGVLLRQIVAGCEAERRQAGSGWSPAPETVKVLALLRRAPIQHQLDPSSFAHETESPPGTEDGQALSAAEAARELGVSPQYVGRLACRGELAGARRHCRVWLIPRSAVAELRRRRASDRLG
jgi:hypothetical protein